MVKVSYEETLPDFDAEHVERYTITQVIGKDSDQLLLMLSLARCQ